MQEPANPSGDGSPLARTPTATPRRRLASVVAVLVGVAIALQGVLAGHDSTTLAVIEIVCGAVAVVCGLASLLTIEA